MVDTDDTRRTTDDSRRTTDDGRRTTPGVWHKLPTGELKTSYKIFSLVLGLLFMVMFDLFSSKIIVLTLLLYIYIFIYTRYIYTCKISAKINISRRVKQNMILVRSMQA